ncbi:MAG TPA: DUF6371 domain-containing protein [Bacteroidia bacterium]|nr:DUF6371 domain-containing protein [Bacteroidia bacterium]
MKAPKYILQPYKGLKSRYHCPACNKSHTFSRYIDAETGEDIAPNVGRCERLNNCNYHYTPKQYFTDNKITDCARPVYRRAVTPGQMKPTYIAPGVFEQSLKNYHSNHFATYLHTQFGAEAAQMLISRYKIGTSKHWPGATAFWQVDTAGNVRTGKIMLYNPNTGKRIKEPFNHITWAHKFVKDANFELKQCLFGEHLLTHEPAKTVCLVESEKTAVIASQYLPDYLWLAVGNLADLSAIKCQAIKDRTVLLFPDLKGHAKWQTKAKAISPRWVVSDYLETHASEDEKEQGLDIADYLLRFSYLDFVKPETVVMNPTPEKPENSFEPGAVQAPVNQQSWDNQISDLETFFATAVIPTHPVKLSPGETISNPVQFIQSHIEVVKANNGNPTFIPFLDRLYLLKTQLQ